MLWSGHSARMIQKAEFTRKTSQTGAVTLIQRFGSSLNLNVHFHMLFVDGVYTTTPWGKSRFHRTNAPNQQKLTKLVNTISHRAPFSGGFRNRYHDLEFQLGKLRFRMEHHFKIELLLILEEVVGIAYGTIE